MKEQLNGIGMTSARTRARLIERLFEQGIRDPRVLDCFNKVPRHLFVDEALGHKAYEDISVPIGYAQTLSQPYIVARMTELVLQAPHHETVLEIGTGSGFQTCVLANVVSEVFSVERIEPLQQKARARIRALKLYNTQLKMADGFLGWPTQAPFDVIIGTAAPSEPPKELVDQLIPDGGRLIMPIGEEEQYLTVIDKHGDELDIQKIEPVVFVPMLQGVKRES
ncbi:protein-L-isoaspartate(D-aspartate) O-methyltransferase [Reinekea marina]|uniref:Protein-L-isoaspartate O-methyltransferase n=1 Tax=Reinekea marina TaxID=1310421 RepID=A0ABV7WU39_9GAMM|nr:protein-L-isoaspartate(D-aspartate) O-methyltransferase [Reinekea marina]MDN3650332.1 protein-L-isoaspartate(D-aspartate) O-methyltransferase [Reinekea marina]MDN3651165.1 protein-L-isoaspartate(D-aspartate) O-methyltransferase [Reinekea marina]